MGGGDLIYARYIHVLYIYTHTRIFMRRRLGMPVAPPSALVKDRPVRVIAHPLLTAAAAEVASQMSSISGIDVTSMNSLLAREYLVCHNRPRALSQKSSVKQQSDTKHGLNPPRPRDVGDKKHVATWQYIGGRVAERKEARPRTKDAAAATW